jgi:hypothetical protein
MAPGISASSPRRLLAGAISFALPLMLALPVVAADAPAKPGLMLFQSQSRVAVDADGKITAIETPASLPAPFTTALESKIRQLHFSAPVIDGRAVSGETWVQVETCAAPVDNAYRLAMKFRGNGPSLEKYVPPQYPFAAMRRGVGAKYDLVFAIAPDGSTQLESATAISGAKGFTREFQQSLEDWVKTMHYRPEVVDGKPVGARVTRKVEFLVGGGTSGPGAIQRTMNKARQEREQATAASETCEMAMGVGDRDDTRQVALDSKIRVSETN